MSVAIVVSNFHRRITDRLLAGAKRGLAGRGVRRNAVHTFRCAGAFELPQVANLLCLSGEFDAVVCLGAVIRGETPHFEYVSAEAARGIQDVALRYAMPVTFGVLTTDTLQQAIDRAGGSAGNKGFDAAEAAVDMAILFGTLRRRLAKPSTRRG